jgi:hypothetical protein
MSLNPSNNQGNIITNLAENALIMNAKCEISTI